MNMVVLLFFLILCLFSKSSGRDILQDQYGKLSDTEQKILKELSFETRSIIMNNYLVKDIKPRPNKKISQRSKERKVGIAALVAAIKWPDAPEEAAVRAHEKPDKNKNHDDLATMTKIYLLMRDTASDSGKKMEYCENIAKQYDNNSTFQTGLYMGKCDATFNVMKEACGMISHLSDHMSGLEHVDAYEKIIILDEQRKKDCGLACNQYQTNHADDTK